MSPNSTEPTRDSRHHRDIELFARLFATWQRGQRERASLLESRFEAIEARLVRLEQVVRMAGPARPSLTGANDPSRGRRDRLTSIMHCD